MSDTEPKHADVSCPKCGASVLAAEERIDALVAFATAAIRDHECCDPGECRFCTARKKAEAAYAI